LLVRLLKIQAARRAVERSFATLAATLRTDSTMHGGAEALRFPLSTKLTDLAHGSPVASLSHAAVISLAGTGGHRGTREAREFGGFEAQNRAETLFLRLFIVPDAAQPRKMRPQALLFHRSEV
jgi:hypothetical protein